MGKRKFPDELLEALRAGLHETAMSCNWDPAGAAALVDVALPRWFSFERRSRRLGRRTGR